MANEQQGNQVNQPAQPGQGGKPKMQIKINDDVLRGAYANSMQVFHTKEEFILDFMNIYPPQGIVNARVVLSPGHLKRIIGALQQNLKKYESAQGEVTAATDPREEIGFRGE